MAETRIAAAILASCLPLIAAAAPSAMGHGKPGASPAASPDATSIDCAFEVRMTIRVRDRLGFARMLRVSSMPVWPGI